MKVVDKDTLSMPTLTARIALGLLLAGALVSGFVTWRNLHDLSRTYAAADAGMRRYMLYGPYLPLLDSVERQVPPGDGLLLAADAAIDPALLAYGLFPRPLWQPDVDPEMRVFFADVPAAPFPRREPGSFPVSWLLHVTPENLPQGGALLRLRNPGGVR